MYIVQRKALMLDLLQKKQMGSVNDLAAELNVSKETIRRDLKDIEQEGLIKRTHGGAVLIKKSANNSENPFTVRAMQHHEEKLALCKKAAELIADGDTIFIDNSSTTLNILKHINPSHHVTVLTNSIRLLLESVQLDNSNLILISSGGIFRPGNFSLTGTLANDWVKNFRPNKMFFSCHGVDIAGGLTDGSIYETDVKRAMIQYSQKTYLLTDHSKFGRQGVVFLAGIRDINHILTNSQLDPDMQQTLLSYGVNLIVV